MPSKLKKAIAVVKDQTSISLAMVKTTRAHNSSSSLEVAILKATSHDDSQINPHHIDDIIRIVASNRAYAAVCARAIGRRVSRTRSWMVALKSLMVVLRLFQDGDPHFPKEVLHAMKSGYKILNLDSSSGSSSELAIFVRSFANYLEERLQCFMAGKLQLRRNSASSSTDLKLTDFHDRIPRWQRLLKKAIAMGLTGSGLAARSNKLTHTTLHAVVQESFDIYKDISIGLAVLLDEFFHLPHDSCVIALDACIEVSRQFDQLRSFYDLCRSSGVGIVTEYPEVKKIPEELIDTLQDYLKDQSSYPATGTTRLIPISLIGFTTAIEGRHRSYDHDRYSDPGDEKPSPLADLSGANDIGSAMSDPDSRNFFGSDFLDHGESTMLRDEKLDDESSVESGNGDENPRGWEAALLETSKGGFGDDFLDANVTSSLLSDPPANQYNPFLKDLAQDPTPVCNVPKSDDDFFTTLNSENDAEFWVNFSDQGKGNSIANPDVDLFATFGNANSNGNSNDNGGMDLFASFDNVDSTFSNSNANVSATVTPSDEGANVGFGFDDNFNPLTVIVPSSDVVGGTGILGSTPTFKATPPSDHYFEEDSVATFSSVESGNYEMGSGANVDDQNVQHQQEMWLQIQHKILAKHLT